MRETLLKLMAVMLTASLGEMFLPDGNIRKYSSVLLAVIVCMTLVSSFKGVDLPHMAAVAENVDIEVSDTFENEVMDEYKSRVEALIEEKCGAGADIITDELGNIKHVIFSGIPNSTLFLTENLGVSENEIEISYK